jgi:chromosome segregation ATPase
MTKSGKAADDGKPAAPDPVAEGPSPELVEQFRQFEVRVDEAVRLIAQLKKDKQELEARLEESAQARAEATRRIDDLIDKIDSLL